MAATAFSTPVNTVTREALTVLITNNILNNSVDFTPDTERMETDSPVRKPNMHPISKKLFHSPLSLDESNKENYDYTQRSSDRSRKARKRKQILIPDSGEKIKRAYVTECERDGYSPAEGEGMRKKVLVSLFHNKEYSMEMDI
ncbi:uncharacterized protein LOC114350874 [Ostrinia furnacalis]|uniref:uncharacterized protein LOC114350874 n=1 Tax=Ostrinia furnacalis TaxID=93504 RepID=UPI00103E7CF7|nr:uncharacterized protein LOC114350874 [Ostrinia furnacalis]